MRVHQDPVVVRRTPTAPETLPVFQEINRTVHLVRPTIGGNAPHPFVDQHQRAGM
jgi:hypothetical protein